MENGEHQITIVTEDGSEELCNILFTFDSDETGYSYVVFQLVGSDEEDNLVHAYRYVSNLNGEGGDLFPIEDDEEWDMVDEVIGAFMDGQDEED